MHRLVLMLTFKESTLDHTCSSRLRMQLALPRNSLRNSIQSELVCATAFRANYHLLRNCTTLFQHRMNLSIRTQDARIRHSPLLNKCPASAAQFSITLLVIHPVVTAHSTVLVHPRCRWKSTNRHMCSAFTNFS